MVVLDPEAARLLQPAAVEGEELEQHGDVYAPRTSPVVVTHGKLVYLFGGTTQSVRVDDLHVLDTETTTWTCVDAEGDLRPGPRSLAEGIVHADRLYVFGGHDKCTPCSAALFAFDFSIRQWEELPGGDSAPTGRTDFTMAATDQELVVFGGFDGNTRCNDLFTYSLADLSWRSVYQHGCVPSRRLGHSGVVHAASNRLIVFGGFDGRTTVADLYALDLKSYTWEQLTTTGEGPTHRYRHTAVVHGDSMLVFGGIDQLKSRFNDLFRLDLLTNTWTRVQINMPHDQAPPTRTFHRMVVVDEKLLVLGGYDGNKRHNSLHAFNLKPKPHEEEEDKEMLAMRTRMRIVVRL